MGYMSLISDCGLCGIPFSSNPDRVPCFPLSHIDRKTGARLAPRDFKRFDPQATKQPVCHACFDYINDYRVRNGAPAHSLPSGAYDAAEGY